MKTLLSICCLIVFFIPTMGQDSNTPFFFNSGNENIDWSRSLLSQEIGKSTRVIGLGEFTHGAREVFAMKKDIIKYLIENKGAEVILFEYPDIMLRYINHYLLDDKIYLDEAARSLILLNLLSAYRTEEIVELCMMIKKHNSSGSQKVQLRGIDISPTIFPPIEHIIRTYVTPADQDAANSLLKLKGEIPDTTLVRKVEQWMLTDKRQINPKITGNDVQNFSYDLKVTKASYLMKTMKWSPLMRDSCMAENVKALAEGHRAVIWAHNHHLMKSISVRGQSRNLGSYLDKYYGTAYYTILTDFFGLAEVVVRRQKPGTSEYIYPPGRFASKKQSFVNDYMKDRKLTESFLVFKKDFRHPISDINLNSIDATGSHYLLSQKRRGEIPFDALIVFKGVGPARMIK